MRGRAEMMSVRFTVFQVLSAHSDDQGKCVTYFKVGYNVTA